MIILQYLCSWFTLPRFRGFAQTPLESSTAAININSKEIKKIGREAVRIYSGIFIFTNPSPSLQLHEVETPIQV